jgi:hypothetical protein
MVIMKLKINCCATIKEEVENPIKQSRHNFLNSLTMVKIGSRKFDEFSKNQESVSTSFSPMISDVKSFLSPNQAQEKDAWGAIFDTEEGLLIWW